MLTLFFRGSWLSYRGFSSLSKPSRDSWSRAICRALCSSSASPWTLLSANSELGIFSPLQRCGIGWKAKGRRVKKERWGEKERKERGGGGGERHRFSKITDQCDWGGEEKQWKELHKASTPFVFPIESGCPSPCRAGLCCAIARKDGQKNRVYSRAGGGDSNDIPSWQRAPPRLASLRSSVASVWVLAEPDREMCGWRQRLGWDDAVLRGHLHIVELIGRTGDGWARPGALTRPASLFSASLCLLPGRSSLPALEELLLRWHSTAVLTNNDLNSIHQHTSMEHTVHAIWFTLGWKISRNLTYHGQFSFLKPTHKYLQISYT